MQRLAKHFQSASCRYHLQNDEYALGLWISANMPRVLFVESVGSRKPALLTAQRTVNHPVGICNLIAESSTSACGVSVNLPRVLYAGCVASRKPVLLTALGSVIQLALVI